MKAGAEEAVFKIEGISSTFFVPFWLISFVFFFYITCSLQFLSMKCQVYAGSTVAKVVSMVTGTRLPCTSLGADLGQQRAIKCSCCQQPRSCNCSHGCNWKFLLPLGTRCPAASLCSCMLVQRGCLLLSPKINLKYINAVKGLEEWKLVMYLLAWQCK